MAFSLLNNTLIHNRSTAFRLFTIGFISILGQVVLLRELNVAFYGIELMYTLAIGIWLIFSGIGTLIGLRKENPSSIHTGILFLLLSAVLPAGIGFTRAVRILFFGTPGAYLPLHIQIFATASVLFPLGLLLGISFRWTARSYIRRGESLTTAYAVESLGGIVGGLVATLFLKFGIQNLTAGLICALTAVAAALPTAGEPGRRALRIPIAVMAGMLILCLSHGTALDLFMTSWTHPDLIATRDSPYSRVTVTSREGQIVVYGDDSLLFESESIRAEEFVHLAALQHPKPENVLVLGGSVEGVLARIQAHTPDIVDYVELNPVLLDIARTRLPSPIQQSLEAENVRIYIDDPRRFLQSAKEYDLILIAMPEPFSGQANRFYTLEFFQQCAARLQPNGIVAFHLPGSENYLPPQMLYRMAGVYRAAKLALPEIMVLPGADSIFLCSRTPLVKDPSILVSRMHSRGMKSSIVTAAYIRYRITNNRSREMAASIQSTTTPINTDAKPICYRYTLMIWLSKFIPSLNHLDFALLEITNKPALYGTIVLLFAVPAAFLRRAGWRVRRAVIMGCAGFAGMVLETILLLRFQIQNGILFQDVGLLLTSFMIGLFLGAAIVGSGDKLLPKRTGAALCIGFASLSGFIGVSVGFDVYAGLPFTFLLLLLSGFLVAATFAYTGLQEPDDQAASIAPLYAADLIGGGLGSLLAGIVLVPIAGLSMTAFLLLPVAFLSLLLVLRP